MRTVILMGAIAIVAVISSGCSTTDEVKASKYSKQIIRTQEVEVE